MKKYFLISGLLVLVCLMFSCGKDSTPTTPTTPVVPTPTVSSVTVTSAHKLLVVGNTEQMTATVKMSDNTTKAPTGTWSSNGPSVVSVNQSGLVTAIAVGGANIYFVETSGVQGDKRMDVRTIWKVNGSGDNVFDMPTYVSRVQITGTYTGYSSNFIVHIGGNYVVNELLGTGWGQTNFSGTYTTTGGTVEILHSSGVTWTFTEVSPQNTMIISPSTRPNFIRQSVPGGEREFEIYRRESQTRR